MTREKVLEKLDGTGIHREEDRAVPVNGAQVKLPYLVVRTKETMSGDDLGRVQMVKIEWGVALFTVNRAIDLEKSISKALAGVGKVEIIHYPDGTPYQTTFKFTTTEIVK